MNNRPHSREKRIVNTTVKVEKKDVDNKKPSIAPKIIKNILKRGLTK